MLCIDTLTVVVEDDTICIRVQDTMILTMLEGIDSDNVCDPIVRMGIIGVRSCMGGDSWFCESLESLEVSYLQFNYPIDPHITDDLL